MRTGFSLLELLMVCTVVGLMTAVASPTVRHAAARLAVRRAATEIVRFHREAQALAIRRAAPVHVRINGDSLIGTLADSAVLERPGPTAFGVQLTITRSEFAFGPAGVAWGPANTRITLVRGGVVDEYVTSRLGRLRRTQ